MNFLNVIRNNLFNVKLIFVSSLIVMNLMFDMLKLQLYYKMVTFITNYSIIPPFEIFIKLMGINCLQHITYHFIEKNIYEYIRQRFNDIARRTMYYKINFFKEYSNNIINEVWFYLDGVEYVIKKLLVTIPSTIVSLSFYLYTLYNISYNSLVTIPIFGLIMYIMHPIMKYKHLYNGKNESKEINLRNIFSETISNMEFVKLNNRQELEIGKIIKSYDDYYDTKIQKKKIALYINTINRIFNNVLLMIIILTSLHCTEPLKILFLMILSVDLNGKLYKFKDVYNHYQKIQSRMSTVYQNIFDGDVEDVYTKYIQDNSNIDNIKNCVKFDNVTFSYDGITNVLQNVSFTFDKGEVNLLLGKNGSGKSTIIKLLLKLYNLMSDNGKIYFLEEDVNNINTQFLRKKISFISQEPQLFNDTVWNNILYGNRNVSAIQIMNICKLLDCESWILENKSKVIGIKGKNMSGSERKRIQLINALCKDSDIVIFDEPSNTLDSKAIGWFSELISKLRNNFGKTIIIITHDIRLKKLSTKIIELF